MEVEWGKSRDVFSFRKQHVQKPCGRREHGLAERSVWLGSWREWERRGWAENHYQEQGCFLL